MGTQQANNRYQRTLEKFKSSLPSNPHLRLSKLCAEVHTDYQGMRNWLRRNNLRLSSVRSDVLSSADIQSGASSFVPFVPPVEAGMSANSSNYSQDVVSNVEIGFNDGTTVSIGHCGVKAISEILLNIRKEASSCSH